MKLRFVILFVLLPLFAQAQRPLVIKGATLVDGSGGPPILNSTVLVVGGRIALIGEGGTLAAPDSAEMVDGKGKTLIPGIINLHGHVGLTKGLAQAQLGVARELLALDVT